MSVNEFYGVHSTLVNDAIAISSKWRTTMDVNELTHKKLEGLRDGVSRIDLVAIGKAAREMVRAAEISLGAQVNRRFIVCGEESASIEPFDQDVRTGEHPVPGSGSLAAGSDLVAFLDANETADGTIFLVSGGASSLCTLPIEPLELEDLRELWDAVVNVGADITTYNKIRAATSRIAGGAILRHVRSVWSQSLIMVDNVGAGAPWVGSALTYDYAPGAREVASLISALRLEGTALGVKLLKASEFRAQSLMGDIHVRHENNVLADSKLLLRNVADHARGSGYKVLDMGSQVQGDVGAIAREWGREVQRFRQFNGRLCIVGTGEVTVEVVGTGRGGRCQEFAWRMAEQLRDIDRETVFVASSSDGRDFIEGVGGGWVDTHTFVQSEAQGMNWLDIVRANDSHRALAALDQLLPGAHTGWNLCDIYLALL